MTDDLERKLDAVYQAAGDRQRLDSLYDKWAQDYDKDLWSSGNPYLAIMAGLAGRYLPDREARILDGGCGTGNMGHVLNHIGYDNLVGIDASDGMLAAARAKGCYQELHKLLLGAKIDLPAESFDAVTAYSVIHLLEDIPGTLRLHHFQRSLEQIACQYPATILVQFVSYYSRDLI